MQINHLTPGYAVSPQIEISDVAALKAAGFTTVICNRPDHEVPPIQQSKSIRPVVEAAGLRFVMNPVEAGTVGQDAVPEQEAAMAADTGKVFAYCRSGTRSSVVWALCMAGQMQVDDIIGAGRKAGYDLSGLRAYLESTGRA